MSLSKHLFPDYRIKSNEEILSEFKSAVNSITPQSSNFFGSLNRSILDSSNWQNIVQPSAADLRYDELEENSILESFSNDFGESYEVYDEDSNKDNGSIDFDQSRMLEQDSISPDLVYFQSNLAEMITTEHIFKAMTANCRCVRNCLTSSFTSGNNIPDYTSAHSEASV